MREVKEFLIDILMGLSDTCAHRITDDYMDLPGHFTRIASMRMLQNIKEVIWDFESGTGDRR